MTGADGITMAMRGERRTHWRDWPVSQLAARKRDLGMTVSVVIPARDEGLTVGEVVTGVAQLSADTGLVNHLVVIDSDSTDKTSETAARAAPRCTAHAT